MQFWGNIAKIGKNYKIDLFINFLSDDASNVTQISRPVVEK